MTITEYNVFPGIWLAFHEIRALSFSPPPDYPAGLLEISHCQLGLAGIPGGGPMLLPGDRGPVPPPQQLPIAVSLPHRAVHGLSVVIDPALAPWCTTCLLGDVEVDLTALCQRFSGEMCPLSSGRRPGWNTFSQSSMPHRRRCAKGYLKVKVLELLLFLSAWIPVRRQGTSCTRNQVELVEKVFAFLGTHRDQRYTAEQLAAAFTSPRSISGGA